MNKQDFIDKWDNTMSKIQKDIATKYWALAQRKKCLQCNHDLEDGLAYLQNGVVSFRPEYLAHAQMTHGLSPEILQEFLLETVYEA